MSENLQNEIWNDIPDFPGFKISNYKRIKKIWKNRKEKILLSYRYSKNGKIYRLSKNKQRIRYVVNNEEIECLPGEIWRDVKGYENEYSVSNSGKIKSKVRIYNYNNLSVQRDKQILNPSFDINGYFVVGLCKNGFMRTIKVHRIVAIGFLQNPNNLPEVNHIDGDKSNNKVENLEWSTSRDNKLHAFRLGLMVARKGSDCNLAKLTENDILEIRKISINTTLTQREIAEKYGITQQQISKIIRRQRWAHLP